MTDLKNSSDRFRRSLIADLPEGVIGKLANQLAGELISPSDPNYDEARAIWNGAIDLHPGLIAKCHDLDDVVACMRFVCQHNLLVSIRGGAHGVGGHALCEGGLVIDLSSMREVVVNPDARIARVQGGATWGDFDKETARFGLATTGGQISSTGVGGLTLGGGLGWLMREFGATVDNLISVEVVTAKAEILTASDVENPDLFWALRGGGGNFGIATSFTFRLHPLDEVLGGAIFWPASRSEAVLHLYREMTDAAPNNLTLMAYFLPKLKAAFIPPELANTPTVAIAVCCIGDELQCSELITRLRSFEEPIGDSLAMMSYAKLQTLYDVTAPFGMKAYWRSCYLSDLDDDAIETISRHAAIPSSVTSSVLITHMGGAMRGTKASENAFGHRDAVHFLEMLAKWTDGPATAHEAWANEFASAMVSHSTGGTYVNFVGDDSQSQIRTAYEPETYRRLRELKQRYDPDNFFVRNRNIPPQP